MKNSKQFAPDVVASANSQMSKTEIRLPYALQKIEGQKTRLDAAIESTSLWYSENQHEDGFWEGMLESNSCMEAEWVLAMHFLGVKNDPKYQNVIQCILNEQEDEGYWVIFHGAEGGDINTTVECYAALRTAGLPVDSEPLVKARKWILENGGLKDIRNFTKYWLALIGEWPWEGVPNLPPEIMFMPSWAPFNIYWFASWARGTMVPLCILSARRPVVPLPEDRQLDELFPEGREKFDYSLPGLDKGESWFSAAGVFLFADWALKLYQDKAPFHPMRETAIKTCLEWLIKHQEADGAWSGIQPPWIYSLMALKTEGYPLEHPVVKEGLQAFDKHWSYERDGGTYLQASDSTVWDTTLSMMSMLDCDEKIQDNKMMQQALAWVMKEQVTQVRGDWSVYVPKAPAGGWAFEQANDFYPDVDDTAVAIIVLARIRKQLQHGVSSQQIDEAIDLAVKWVECMQSQSGGWAAFDKDNTHKILTKIPFADFGELLDPPSVDVTAHVIEAFGLLGRGLNDPFVASGVQYIMDEQEDDYTWFGRWGVNHIYGTAAVLPALEAVGYDMKEPRIIAAGEWVASKQNADGGWGETPASYMDDNLRGVGDSTASQTGWALMALLALNTHKFDDVILKALEYLLKHQIHGTWDEPQYTGTGFPGYAVGERINLKEAGDLHQGLELSRAFMINYNMYRHYFPAMALGRARRHFAG
ncbi:MAG: squalene--hopene cyclase [Verrucomicrobiota bacterium]